MFSATIYIETSDGKIEKISASFKNKEDRDTWVMDKIKNYSFTYLILNNRQDVVKTA